MLALQAVLGLCVFVAIAWVLSEHRWLFPWRAVLAGLVLQFGIASVLLLVPGAQQAFLWLNQLVIALMTVGMATLAGTMLVLYATVIGAVLDDALGHLIIASLRRCSASRPCSTKWLPTSNWQHSTRRCCQRAASAFWSMR